MNTPMTPDERAAINDFAMTQGKPVADITDQLAQALEHFLGRAKVYGRAGATNHPGVRCDVEGLTLGDFYALNDALAAYRASKEGEKVEYRDLIPDEDRFEEGDQFQTPDGTWWQIPSSNIGKVYFRRAYLPHRRPIRAT